LTGEGHVIRLQVQDISVQKRYSRGVLLIKLSADDKIVGLARFKAEKEE
jgi:DNA gyrase subunit A